MGVIFIFIELYTFFGFGSFHEETKTAFIYKLT